jgi:hypothetical protein
LEGVSPCQAQRQKTQHIWRCQEDAPAACVPHPDISNVGMRPAHHVQSSMSTRQWLLSGRKALHFLTGGTLSIPHWLLPGKLPCLFAPVTRQLSLLEAAAFPPAGPMSTTPLEQPLNRWSGPCSEKIRTPMKAKQPCHRVVAAMAGDDLHLQPVR